MHALTLLSCEPIVVMFYAWSGPGPTLAVHMSMLTALTVVVLVKAVFFAVLSEGTRVVRSC